jgi:para-nitrobenzyl esterase
MIMSRLRRLPEWTSLALLLPLCACSEEPGEVPAPPDLAMAPDSASPPPCRSEVTPRPGTVVTDRGAVTGLELAHTFAWKGVPFAAPPVGPLRFQPPAPHPCWEDERPATAFGRSCLQMSPQGRMIGGEDCLTLNIWAPKEGTGRPVLFFVHGGGNVQGGSAESVAGADLYDGEALSERAAAVVVTANYRLGALGFLAHPALAAERKVSGNYGLLDQIAALAFVRRNIAAFGGDPDRVLLFGESAGALDTCALLTSPLARGLFQAALMESGGCAATPRAEAEAFGKMFASATGCAAAPDVPACLRGLSPETILKTYPYQADVAGKPGPYGPHVDGEVLPEPPLEVIAAGRHHRVPLIVGANADETSRAVENLSEEYYRRAVYALVNGNKAAGDQILAQYPVAEYGTPRKAYVALTSDVKFICPARTVARTALRGQHEPVYRYHFTTALKGDARLTPLGAWHGLELLFVFQHLTVAGYAPTPAESALAVAMAGYWGRLAERGDPNGPEAAAWPRYTAADPYLRLDSSAITAGQGVRTRQCDFWDRFLR